MKKMEKRELLSIQSKISKKNNEHKNRNKRENSNAYSQSKTSLTLDDEVHFPSDSQDPCSVHIMPYCSSDFMFATM